MATYEEKLKILQQRRNEKGLALLNDLLPLRPNATFEELVEVSKKMSGNSIYYPELEKAIKAHPAYKKVVADLNTGEYGRNYSYLKRPDTTIGTVNRIYEEVKERTGQASKILDNIYKSVGNFLHEDTRDKYLHYGIPYKNVYLIYGPPGTGKTSLIRSICSNFDCDLFVLPIQKKNLHLLHKY